MAEHVDPIFELAHDVKDIAPDTLKEASIIAASIVRSEHYRNKLFDLFSSIKPSEVQKFIKGFAGKLVFTIKRIRYFKMHDSYGLVFRDKKTLKERNTIYLSTLMLLEMKDTERELQEVVDGSRKGLKKNAALNALTEAKNRHIIFLVVKLVHEISHVINRQVIITVFKEKQIERTTVKSFNGHRFSDFGEIVEFKLFGGIIEHAQEPSNHAFAISNILSYDYKGSAKGFFVYPEENEGFLAITNETEVTEESVRLTRSKLFITIKSTGNLHKLKLSTARVSAAYSMEVDEESIVEAEVGEEESSSEVEDSEEEEVEVEVEEYEVKRQKLPERKYVS